jgi:hypothetical protein
MTPSCTKPGGYVEHAESSAPMYCDDQVLDSTNGAIRFCQTLTNAMEVIGRPPASAESMKKCLEDAGFVDVTVKTYKQPVAPWPKDKRLKNIGAMALLNCQTAFTAYGMAAFTRILGMTKGKAERLCEGALEAIRDRKNHIYGFL